MAKLIVGFVLMVGVALAVAVILRQLFLGHEIKRKEAARLEELRRYPKASEMVVVVGAGLKSLSGIAPLPGAELPLRAELLELLGKIKNQAENRPDKVFVGTGDVKYAIELAERLLNLGRGDSYEEFKDVIHDGLDAVCVILKKTFAGMVQEEILDVSVEIEVLRRIAST